jgi:hypothetical protein
MSYVGTHRPEKTGKCVLGHICLEKKEYNTRTANYLGFLAFLVSGSYALCSTGGGSSIKRSILTFGWLRWAKAPP